VGVVRLAAWAVVAACGVVGARAASADATDDALAKARAGLVSRLETLLSWAQDQGIAGWRHGIARRILEVAPDHSRARATLKYKRASKNAPWVQDPSYVEPADVKRALLPDAEKRLAAVTAWYRDEVVAAAEGAEPARREALLESLLDVAPDDADVRRRLGHVEEGGRWALPEVHRGLRRRAELVAFGAAAREAAGPRVKRDPEGTELGWYALQTPKRSVMSAMKWPAEVREALVFMEAGDAVAQHLFGAEQEIGKEARPPIPALYFCDSKEAGRALMAQFPEAADRVRDLELLSGVSLGSRGYLRIEKDPERVSVAGVRVVVDVHVTRTLGPWKRGWITEGLGQRMVWYATGRHGPPFVNIQGTDVARAEDEIEDEPIPPSPSGWLAASGRALERHGERRLAAALVARLNAMRSTDVLLGYGLAAYLAEAFPKSLVPFCRASMASTDPAAIVREVFEMDFGSFAARLKRWLKDTAG
jgi:hypothetical protein